ncbi:hypothetical protein AMC87_PB00116 (plasmid) [Rhizobium phaseoli]|nr:hypothetical protein AMC87_PB00116 [Rhizobium phaseoli]EGE61100.1 hypothetical protein RHECNPAF_1260083 [Rhizobium etli CNPAF512]
MTWRRNPMRKGPAAASKGASRDYGNVNVNSAPRPASPQRTVEIIQPHQRTLFSQVARVRPVPGVFYNSMATANG